MSKDCRHDCASPRQFPQPVNNRPGLDRLAYRIGTYSDFRQALFDRLDRETSLRAWTYRGPDDPGIALLEGASILGDILTFYQELYANEAYLRTARWRESLGDLVRLLGYRLSPGLGGKGTFAFEVKGDRPAVIPVGFPLKAPLQGMEQPAEFETSRETVAYPALNKFALYRPAISAAIGAGSVLSLDTKALEQEGLQIQPKDRLMLLDEGTPHTKVQIVVVKKVEQQFNRTNVTVEGAFQAASIGYKLGRTFRHFGHNAPPQVVTPGSPPTSVNIVYTRNLKAPTQTVTDKTISPAFAATDLPLDSQVPDLVLGGKLIIEGVNGRTNVRTITACRPASMTWGALSGATTIVTLASTLNDGQGGQTADIRLLAVHEALSGQLTLKTPFEPILSPTYADGKRLYFFGGPTTYQLLHQRRLALVRDDGASCEMVVSTEPVQPEDTDKAFRPLLLGPPLGGQFTLNDFPLDKPRVTVYGNLVDATQGKTEKEAVLGNGDHRQQFQTFKLPKAPLTYLNATGETPPEVPELQVYVNDRLWKQVPSLFGHGSKEEIYIVREDANGESWIQFGDGQTGARLPSGLKNVMAKYRVGAGAHGNLQEGATVQSGGKLSSLDKVQLPGVVSGGSRPETGDHAREAAPGKVQSLGRLVSLQDFESEALAIPGVARAIAAWARENHVPAIVLTLLMETGRAQEYDEVRRILAGYNQSRGPNRHPIITRQGKIQYVYLDASYVYDHTFRPKLLEEAIRQALGAVPLPSKENGGTAGLFVLLQRRFGQPEYVTTITAAIQNVPGVIWAKVKALGTLGDADDPSDLGYPPATKSLNPVVPCDSLHILGLWKDHLQLNGQAGPNREDGT
jgi:hypothetical protein